MRVKHIYTVLENGGPKSLLQERSVSVLTRQLFRESGRCGQMDSQKLETIQAFYELKTTTSTLSIRTSIDLFVLIQDKFSDPSIEIPY